MRKEANKENEILCKAEKNFSTVALRLTDNPVVSVGQSGTLYSLFCNSSTPQASNSTSPIFQK
jgi:hypothetical protein